MDDLDPFDLEVKKILEPIKDQKPPASVMKDFDEAVFRKIHHSGGPGAGMVLAVTAVMALAMGGAFLLLIMSGPIEPIREEALPGAEPVISREIEIKPVVHETKPGLAVTEQQTAVRGDGEEQLMALMADDLFILEMLGEDAGLTEDLELMEIYAEYLSAAQTVI